MKTEVKSINEILMNVFKNNMESEKNIGILELIYNHDNQEYVLEFNSKLVRTIKEFSEIKYQFKFTIDFDSINAFLPDDNKLNNEGKRQKLAKSLSRNLKKLIEFTQLTGAFNGDKDYCKEIADFIEKNWTWIIAGGYGLT
jgi:hypothetical protein